MGENRGLWKQFTRSPWAVVVSLFCFIIGLPGMRDDADWWLEWATVNPQLSGILVGVGGMLLVYFVAPRIEESWADSDGSDDDSEWMFWWKLGWDLCRVLLAISLPLVLVMILIYVVLMAVFNILGIDPTSLVSLTGSVV